MPISAWHVWHHSALDLRINSLSAQAADSNMAMPVLLRRKRLAQWRLDGRRYPRHLYKFRSIPGDKGNRARLEQLILGHELYAPTCDKFNDPFDAQADYQVAHGEQELRELVYRYLLADGAPENVARGLANDDVLKSPERTAELMKENHQKILQQLGVYCLAATARDPLLWAHYAHDHHGIAVQFRPSMDLKAMQIHPVEYNSSYPIIDNYFDRETRDLFSPLLRKSTSWSYEDEWRIIRVGQPNRTFSIRPEAITGVLLGLRISDEDRGYIEGLAQERDRRHGVKTCLYQSERSPGKYDVRFRRFR